MHKRKIFYEYESIFNIHIIFSIRKKCYKRNSKIVNPTHHIIFHSVKKYNSFISITEDINQKIVLHFTINKRLAM